MRSRIDLLAPLPGERKPAIGSAPDDAQKPRKAKIFPNILQAERGVPECVLLFSSLTSRKIPERFSGFARASAWKPISSNPPASRSATVIFAAPAWIYLDHVQICRHDSWTKFEAWRAGDGGRLVVFSTRAARPYLEHRYLDSDILLFGRESAGVTQDVVEAADERLVIPIAPGMRSLNVAMSVAMALGEGLRQTGGGTFGHNLQSVT